MWVNIDMSADEDFDQAEAALSSLGITGFHEIREVEPMVLESRAYT